MCITPAVTAATQKKMGVLNYSRHCDCLLNENVTWLCAKIRAYHLVGVIPTEQGLANHS